MVMGTSWPASGRSITMGRFDFRTGVSGFRSDKGVPWSLCGIVLLPVHGKKQDSCQVDAKPIVVMLRLKPHGPGGTTMNQGKLDLNMFPVEIRKIYDDLWLQTFWTHLRWDTVRDVLGDRNDVKRPDLLTAVAANFFDIFRQDTVNEICLSLNRLADNAEGRGGRDQNLTLDTLVKEIDNLGEEALRDSLQDKRDRLVDFLDNSGIRGHRHKTLAHRDLATATGRAPAPIARTTYREIGDALEMVREIVNEAEAHWCGQSFDYTDIPNERGGKALVRALKESQRYRENLPVDARREDDLRQSEWWDA